MRRNKATKPKYHFALENGVLVIEDEGSGASVTNYALEVVAEIEQRIKKPLNKRPIVYCDSNGDWDVIRYTTTGVTFLYGGGNKSTAKALAIKNAEHKMVG